MNAAATSTAELAQLNWRLGLAYAEAVSATVDLHNIKLELIGCHGQTLYISRAQPCMPGAVCLHLAGGRSCGYCRGARSSGHFKLRPADMLAGGQGAPLVRCLTTCCLPTRSVGACCKHRRHCQPDSDSRRSVS